jgi:Fe-S-cluster containining protein
MNGAFGGCATCVGECCRRYVVPVTIADVGAIVRATALHPAEFLALRAVTTELSIPGFRLQPSGREAMLILDRKVPSGACVFLVELPAGPARCGAYGYRPRACRTFPTALRNGTATIRTDVVCGPGAWSSATMDLPSYGEDLVSQRNAWAEHARIARTWNERVDTGGTCLTAVDLLTFLLTTI